MIALTSGDSGRMEPGCPDNDEDGWANPEDTFPDDITQWADYDGDGYVDNLGEQIQMLSIRCRNSTQGNRPGCVDTDDGWDDVIDVLPNMINGYTKMVMDMETTQLEYSLMLVQGEAGNLPPTGTGVLTQMEWITTTTMHSQ